MPYLDHAATTPILPEAIDAMSEAMVDVGNASSLHGSGRRARRRVEEARELLGAGFAPVRRRSSSPAAERNRTTSPSRGCSGRGATRTRDVAGSAPARL